MPDRFLNQLAHLLQIPSELISSTESRLNHKQECTPASSPESTIEPMELYANALFHRKIDAIISHERKIVANMRLTDIACSLSVPTILLDLRCEITL